MGRVEELVEHVRVVAEVEVVEGGRHLAQGEVGEDQVVRDGVGGQAEGCEGGGEDGGVGGEAAVPAGQGEVGVLAGLHEGPQGLGQVGGLVHPATSATLKYDSLEYSRQLIRWPVAGDDIHTTGHSLRV